MSGGSKNSSSSDSNFDPPPAKPTKYHVFAAKTQIGRPHETMLKLSNKESLSKRLDRAILEWAKEKMLVEAIKVLMDKAQEVCKQKKSLVRRLQDKFEASLEKERRDKKKMIDNVENSRFSINSTLVLDNDDDDEPSSDEESLLELEANDDRKVLIEAGRVVGLLQLQSFTANELQVLGGFVDLFEPEEMRTQVDEASSSCTQVATRSSGRHNSGKKDKSKKGDKSKSGHGKKNSNAKHNQTTLPPPVSSTQLYGNLDDDVDFNEIVCSIGPFELTHESLKSLESEPSKHDRRLLSHLFSGHFSNGFIESKAINACIWLLCRDQRTLSFFPAESVYYMMDPKTTFPVKNKLPPLDINTREVTTFVMPILKNKQHWLLMLYDVRKNRLQLLDSKEPVGENSLDDETLQLIMYNLFTGWHVDAREAEVFQVKCAQQDSQDQASCGAFVVHFVQCLINGLPFTTPCNPQQMRRVMFESIIEEAHILVD